MRNLRQYPITELEILEVLRRVSLEKASDGTIGGTDSVCLDVAAEIVEAAYNILRGIEKRFKDNPGSALRYCTPWDKATDLIHACHPQTKETP